MPKSGWMMLCGASALAFSAAPAMAAAAAPAADPQANAPAATDTGEIVVTAQKRAERLQDVPISVAAVTGDTVAALHASTLQGLQGSVPNVSIGNFSNTPNTAVFTIRGIGVIEPDPYAGNTVGIVVDGVPQYFSMGALVDLYDVKSIEILRGPQGTLFGANTTGGVVNVTNNAPELDKLSMKADAAYGNYNHLQLGTVINTPLGDHLAARFAIDHDEREGYVTNVVTGRDMGKRNVTIMRGSLRYAEGDFDATLTGEYDRARNGSPVVVAGDTPADVEYVPAGLRGMYASPCLPAGQRCTAPSHYYSAQDGGINGDTPDLSNMDAYRAGLTMSLANTPIGDITSVTGYKKIKIFEFTDQDGTPIPLIQTRRTSNLRQFSQELRTDIKVGSAFKATVGAFYMNTHYTHEQDLQINFAGGYTYDATTDTVTYGLPGLFQRNKQNQDNNSISVFGQGYLQITPQLEAVGGIRYTHEKTSMLASTDTYLALTKTGAPSFSTYDGTSATDGTPDVQIGAVDPARGTKSWNNAGWRLGLNFKATPDMLLYGYWARGFKSGGYTGRIGIAQDLGPYAPEKVDTFEVGVKSQWLDRKVTFNLAGFYTNYRGMQLAQIYFVGSGASLVQGNTILNAASAHIKGFEAELTVVPTQGLRLNASLAYLDAKYSKFDYLLPSGSTMSLAGQRLQNAPKWSGSLAASYEVPLQGEMAVKAAVSYNFTSEKLLTSIIDTPRARVQPQHLVNANLDLKLNEHLTVGVWATNLFDKRYINSVFDAPGTLGLTNYAPPRMFGGSIKAQF